MKIRCWHAIGAVFTVVLGTVLHFSYEATGFMTEIAFFEAVNESIWEHLKLIYWPTVLFMIVEYWGYGSKTNGFFVSECLGILAAMAFTVGVFYTYTGIIGKGFLFVDILIFVVAVILGRVVMYKSVKKFYNVERPYDLAALMAIVIIGILFFLFTFYPPDLGIFQSTVK